MRIALACLVMVAACGPSTMEVKTAKSATYNAEPGAIFELAQQAAAEDYKLAAVNGAGLELLTAPRFYSGTGDLESPGAGGVINMQAGTVQVSFIVQVVPTAEHAVTVHVTPKTFQLVAGSPKPRELAPDDPNLPPFVLGRADALALRIYQLAQRYTAAPR